MKSDVPNPPTPAPVGNGWELHDGNIMPVLFDDTATADMLDGLICACRGRHQCDTRCSCLKNNLPCTEQCICGGGENCNNENASSSNQSE